MTLEIVKSGLYTTHRRIMDTEKKPAVKSKSIWGSVLSFLPVIYLLEKSFDLPAGILDQLIASGNEVYLAIVGLVGILLQIWGRVKANPNISGLLKVKEK